MIYGLLAALFAFGILMTPFALLSIMIITVGRFVESYVLTVTIVLLVAIGILIYSVGSQTISGLQDVVG